MFQRHVLGSAALLVLWAACGGTSTGAGGGARGGGDDPEVLVRGSIASVLGGGGLAGFYPPHDVVAAICDGDAGAVSAVFDAEIERAQADLAETPGLELEVLGVSVPGGEPQRWTIGAGEVWRGGWAEGACTVRQPIEVAELTVQTRATYQGETRQGEAPVPVVRIRDRWYLLATTPARERAQTPLEAALDACREMYAHVQPLMGLRDATDAEVLGLCEGTSRATHACILSATDEPAIQACIALATEDLCVTAGLAVAELSELEMESTPEPGPWLADCTAKMTAADVACIAEASTYADAARCSKPFYE